MDKRGAKSRSAGGVAIFIFILALVLVLYVLFLPPEERAKILEESPSYQGTSSSELSTGLNSTRVLVKGLHIDYINKHEVEHDLTPFYLFSTTSGEELFSANSFYIKNNWFSTQNKVFSVPLEDPENLENVKLTFSVKKPKGILKVKFNDRIIYEGIADNGNIEPINIPKSLLKEKNSLMFEVSDVGGMFWESNHYIIKGLKIVGDHTDISRQKSSNTVILSKEEISNLDSATLLFYPDCVVSQVGKLQVTINNNLLVNQVPDCSVLNHYEIPKSFLKEGPNSIIFSTEKGSYLIDQIKLKTKLKKEVLPLYYFDVTESEYEDIQDDALAFNLSVKFVKNYEATRKEFDVIINGHLFRVDTYDDSYSRILIKDWIEKGVNYIKINPKESLDIVELRLTLTSPEGTVSEDTTNDEECIKKYTKACYRGDVWWYDSCGKRYRLYDRCASDEDCENGRCVKVRD